MTQRKFSILHEEDSSILVEGHFKNPFGEVHSLCRLHISKQDFEAGLLVWETKLIQDAFPALPVEERSWLLDGLQ
jgi:hypothetical protein